MKIENLTAGQQKLLIDIIERDESGNSPEQGFVNVLTGSGVIQNPVYSDSDKPPLLKDFGALCDEGLLVLERERPTRRYRIKNIAYEVARSLKIEEQRSTSRDENASVIDRVTVNALRDEVLIFRERCNIYLLAFFDKVYRSNHKLINSYELGAELGFSKDEVKNITDFWLEKRFITWETLGGYCSITHNGSDWVENHLLAISSSDSSVNPQKGTEIATKKREEFLQQLDGAFSNDELRASATS